MKEITEALGKGENDQNIGKRLTTKRYKLISFAGEVLSQDDLTIAVKMQNAYLHDNHAILVINCEQIDKPFFEGENEGMKVEGPSFLETSKEDGEALFYSIDTISLHPKDWQRKQKRE